MITVLPRIRPALAIAVAATAFVFCAATTAVANELANDSFESPDASGGDVNDAPGAPWLGFNDPNVRFTTQALARSGSQSVKTFGPFDFIGGGAGATQKIPALENFPYQAGIFAQHITDDALQGGNFGVYKIEFLDADMNLVAGLEQPAGTPLLGYNVFESDPINSSSPLDTWIELDASGFSPPGTEYVQAAIVQVQLGDGEGNFTGGAIFWDDASVNRVPEPTTMLLGVFGIIGCCGMARRREV